MDWYARPKDCGVLPLFGSGNRNRADVMRKVKNSGTTTRKKIVTRLRRTMRMVRMIRRFDKVTFCSAGAHSSAVQFFHAPVSRGSVRGSAMCVASRIATNAVMTAHKVVTAR